MGCATSLPLGGSHRERRQSSVTSPPNNVTPENNHHDNNANSNASQQALHIVLNSNDRPSSGKNSFYFSFSFSLPSKIIRRLFRQKRPVSFFGCFFFSFGSVVRFLTTLTGLWLAVAGSLVLGHTLGPPTGGFQPRSFLLSYREFDQSTLNRAICKCIHNEKAVGYDDGQEGANRSVGDALLLLWSSHS